MILNLYEYAALPCRNVDDYNPFFGILWEHRTAPKCVFVVSHYVQIGTALSGTSSSRHSLSGRNSHQGRKLSKTCHTNKFSMVPYRGSTSSTFQFGNQSICEEMSQASRKTITLICHISGTTHLLDLPGNIILCEDLVYTFWTRDVGVQLHRYLRRRKQN